MKDAILALLFIALASGCICLPGGETTSTTTTPLLCEKPYIRVGASCCLDQDDNKICDRDEPGTTMALETSLAQTTTIVSVTTVSATTVTATTLESTVTTSTPATTVPFVTSTLFPEKRIRIEKLNEYQLVMSFVGDDGQRHDNVHLDGGPFAPGDLFVINGNVYEYEDYDIKSDNKMEIVLKDVINFNKEEAILKPLESSDEIKLKTYAFDTASQNDDTITLYPEENVEDTTVYDGSILGVDVLNDYGDLYLNVDDNNKNVVGVTRDVVGTNYMNEFRVSGRGISITVIDENGVNLNGGSGSIPDDDSNDRLIKIKDADGEFVYIDMFDRDHTKSDNKYTMSMKVSSKDITNTALGKPDATVDDVEDNLIILPKGKYRIKAEYGDENNIKAVDIWI